MQTRDIYQEIAFKTDAMDLYKCLMDARRHSSFTGGEVVIEDKPNAKFSVFDGYAYGVNKRLTKGKEIVQSWRAEEDGWPEDYFSEVRFEFEETEGGTLLKFWHKGVPTTVADAIENGWNEYYWQPLQEYINR
jgi:activator of HSP90 ATPase